MKWLITGGCGFIGTNLIGYLAGGGGHSIRVVDNLSVGTREDLRQVALFEEKSLTDGPNWPGSSAAGPVQLVVGDICDEALALKAANGADIIVHLAAKTGVPFSVEHPKIDCLNNVIGLVNYLEAARHCSVRRFIFASSGAPIGDCEPPIHEELACHPVSPYGASKLAGEGYCSAYFRTFGLETVALRFGNVYGPGSGRKTSVVVKFVRRAMRREPLEIYGDGNQTRDFIFIEDLTRAIVLAARAEDVGGEVFQIATSRETTVSEIAGKLRELLAEAGIENVQLIHTEPRLGDVRRNFSDTSKAERMLGWRAQVDLDSGLRLTVKWCLAGLFS